METTVSSTPAHPLSKGTHSLTLFHHLVVPMVLIGLMSAGDQGEGVCALCFWGMEKDGMVHNGVQIELLVDIPDVADDLHGMEFVEGTTSGLIKPSLSFCLDKAAHDKHISEEHVKKAHDAARSAHGKLPKDDQVKKFVLQFPKAMNFKLLVTQKPFVSAAVASDDNLQSQKVKPEVVVRKIDNEFQ